jgi:hypothetical protein
MNVYSPVCVIAMAIGCSSLALGQEAPCDGSAPCGVVYYQREPARPSWIFAPSTYTHDPETGARVAQYMRPAPVEPLDDPRIVTSRYRRVRTNLRGPDGSNDTTYDVQNWGNGRGGLDAEWQNFHDAWKDSYLTGGSFNQQNPGWNGPGWNGGWNNGWNNGGNNGPWNNGGWNNGGWNNGGWNNGGWNNGGWNNGGWNNGGWNNGPWNNGGWNGPNQGPGFPPGQGMPPQHGPPRGGQWGGNGHHGGGQNDGTRGRSLPPVAD